MKGTPIRACANVDARAAREVSGQELHNNTFENKEFIADRTNTGFKCHPQIIWLAHHRSDIYRRKASTITTISDWLAYMLSGELAVDPSNAGTTGLLI